MKSPGFYLLAILTIGNASPGWDYPVKPGTDEWRSLSYEEKIASQQIPLETLNSMSTKELFQAWLELPGRLELLAYNSMQQGFEVTVLHFNVLPELMKRKDIGSRPDILATLYSLGPFKTSGEERIPHLDPVPNRFGSTALEFYSSEVPAGILH